ncbi:MAG: flagellar type III secretion system pore protein FliP [Alphaproteobacteria bacterium]|nr:flagellar type III secretion system pore protein FliP [Alphaproteobacteria bacterium]
MTSRTTRLAAFAASAIALAATSAAAQSVSIDFGDGPTTTGRIVQLFVLMGVLSLAPSILVMVTSFTRIVVVLSFLRSAIGLQQTPPNAVIISLALFLTAFIMAPTLEAIYRDGVAPLMDGRATEIEAFARIAKPLHDFMIAHTRPQDLKLFGDLAGVTQPNAGGDVSLRILVPAFMIGELKRAFEIGFLLFVPFLVIDMVVASVLMSMGMMMLPPAIISLPFKLVFFVLVDGWHLVAGSLVQSFGPTTGG